MTHTPFQNDTFLRALKRQPHAYTPIWIMRQAGRYLPEYRSVRAKAGSFLTLCKTPELACEVTLQPLARFPLDAAIIFSDILTIPDAMGLGLYFENHEGPRFEHPANTEVAISALPIPDPEADLGYVMEAIRNVKRALGQKVPLIGFAGSPWTVATYMVEGGGSKHFQVVKSFLYRSPELLHQLLHKLARATTDYLLAQVHAGADVLMLFDTWGGLLTPQAYETFSLSYMRAILTDIRKNKLAAEIPVIFFTKQGGQWLEQIADSGCDAVGLDWTTDIAQAKARIGDRVTLQGNLDPAVLYASPEKIEIAVKDILAGYGDGDGHVMNLGHGIYPDVPIESVETLVNAVHKHSRKDFFSSSRE